MVFRGGLFFAIRLPRRRTLFRRIGLVVALEAEQLLQRVQVRRPAAVRIVALAERLDRVVQQLVDDAAGELLKLLTLGLARAGELVERAIDLLLRQRVV